MHVSPGCLAFFACSALSMSGQPSLAASKTGGDLATQCGLTSNLAVIACHIYIHAVLDVLEDDTVKGNQACVPAGSDIDGLVQVVTDWVAQHPGEGQIPAPEAVARAISASYPCG